MVALKQYLLSVLGCALVCGIFSQMVADTSRKKGIHMICGIVTAISICYPLTKVDLEKYVRFPDADWLQAEDYISSGVNAASLEQEKRIKDSCQTYILDKARGLDTEIKIEITLNEEGLPYRAEIQGEAEAKVQKELQRILETDLGISKENQTWIRNQESSNS